MVQSQEKPSHSCRHTPWWWQASSVQVVLGPVGWRRQLYQPCSTSPTLWRASASRSGSLPFRSTDARQPWYPSRDAINRGRLPYMLFPTPPTLRAPLACWVTVRASILRMCTLLLSREITTLCHWLSLSGLSEFPFISDGPLPRSNT
ncbi:hypothetical protein EYF80_013494 [Liparis tanakae]|uniref:Uncharacterized protein n=1 Tax=Liparis tanakae TaxID=230148 RepID=A0A4Z2IE08_9TELE|nr:hypothetical protein EYF80_013494 [Liparis tanakae]